MTLDRPELPAALRAFLACGLILDPWLAGLAEECFSFESQDLIARAADGLAGEHWREPVISATLGDLPVLRSVARRAAQEVLTSTAAAMSHERVGRIAVDAGMAAEVIRRMERFIAEQGFGALVLIFLAITVTESQGALAYYGRMSEEDFIRGTRHRPWTRGPLDDELVAGLAAGNYRIVVREGRRWVVATPAGRRLLMAVRGMLAESGYLAERLRLTWVSHFNLHEDMDRFVAQVLPQADALRLAVTDFCGVGPGMSVCDVGCGTAAQMFEGGLWKAVGPRGSLVGVDSAVGMLERARRKAEAHQARNVEFIQGRAEALPLARGRFDATLAGSVLEYTDLPRAVAEMVRVTRPGGVVVAVGATQADLESAALRNWFAPVVRLAERYGVDPAARIRQYRDLGATFAAAGLQDGEERQGESSVTLSDPDFTVRSAAQGSGFVQEVLERLPWGARQDLITELVERGRRICAKTSPEERTIQIRTHFVRAKVPAATRAGTA